MFLHEIMFLYKMENFETLMVDCHQNEQRISIKMMELLHGWCLLHGTTFEGSRNAIKHHLRISQKVPVCICLKDEIMFFPLPSRNSNEYFWMRYQPTLRYKGIGIHQTKVFDKSGVSWCLDIDVRMIRRQYQRCATFLSVIKESKMNLVYKNTQFYDAYLVNYRKRK